MNVPDHIAFAVTVRAFALDGSEVRDVVYHWITVVEVGFKRLIGG